MPNDTIVGLTGGGYDAEPNGSRDQPLTTGSTPPQSSGPTLGWQDGLLQADDTQLVATIGEHQVVTLFSQIAAVYLDVSQLGPSIAVQTQSERTSYVGCDSVNAVRQFAAFLQSAGIVVHDRISLTGAAGARCSPAQNIAAALPDLPFILAGAGGTQIRTGSSCRVMFEPTSVTISGGGTQDRIAYASIVDLQMTGSTVTKNLGVFGGGFGVVGAAEGMLAAGVINALTTRRKRYAVLRIVTATSEYVLSTTERDGSQLAPALIPVQVRIRAARSQRLPSATPQAASVADEIRKLASLRSEGLLTDEEFAQAKARLLSS